MTRDKNFKKLVRRLMAETGRRYTDVRAQLRPQPSSGSSKLPACELVVDCGGERHRVAVGHDSFTLHDHDASSEATLAALGGSGPFCLVLYRAWLGVRTDPVLAFSLLFAGDPRGRSSAPYVMADLGRLAEKGAMRRPEVLLDVKAALPPFLELPPELRAAIVDPVLREAEATWPEIWQDDTVGGQYVGEKFRGALRMVLGSSIDLSRPSFPDLRLELAPPDVPATIEGRIDDYGVARVRARLHVSWARTVHAHGLSAVGGAFVVDLLEDAGDHLRVLAARWVDGVLACSEAVLSREGGGWRLDWEDPRAMKGGG